MTKKKPAAESVKKAGKKRPAPAPKKTPKAKSTRKVDDVAATAPAPAPSAATTLWELMCEPDDEEEGESAEGESAEGESGEGGSGESDSAPPDDAPEGEREYDWEQNVKGQASPSELNGPAEPRDDDAEESAPAGESTPDPDGKMGEMPMPACVTGEPCDARLGCYCKNCVKYWSGTVPEGIFRVKPDRPAPFPVPRKSPPAPAPAPAPAASVPKSAGLAASLRDGMSRRSGDAPHLIGIARAGTGKTWTFVEGLKETRGLRGAGAPEPSPQQLAIWDALKAGKSPKFTGFVAFSRPIAEELKTKVPAGVDAMTMHSLGLKAIRRAFNLTAGDGGITEYRVSEIISELVGMDVRDFRREKPTVLTAVQHLVRLCKMNLVHAESADQDMSDELYKLASHYDVDLDGREADVFPLVPAVLRRCLDVARDGCVDYNDMIWLPVVLKLPVFRYDLLLVDEAQDLNRCQQALAMMAGRRLGLIGDPKQAIYGFTGADAESIPRMEKTLGLTPQGCDVFPLTVTRRCGRAIVEEARKLVPDFTAHESNPDGLISHGAYPVRRRFGKSEEVPYEQTYMPKVAEGDMVLCRTNAPLVGQCFRFIKRGRKANIQGRDVGEGLVSTVEKLGAESVPHLVGRVTDWLAAETAKESAKRYPSEARLIALADRADCLMCFTEGASSVGDVTAKIKSIFTDDRKSAGVRLSSIHKAKGLEARHVFLLRPAGAECPHPMAKSAWQVDQEHNLLYVAITRAIEELTYVS